MYPTSSANFQANSPGTMALHCLALLGHKNEPLYLCSTQPFLENDKEGVEPQQQQRQQQQQQQQQQDDNEEDVFGFLVGPAAGSSLSPVGLSHRAVSIRHEMMIHSALDRLEEMLGSPKKGSVSNGRFQRGSHWLGVVCPMEEFEIYGYVTSSDVKILALMEREGELPLQKRKEVDIKMLFTAVHDAYVRHMMNPFSKIRAKIEPPCTNFELGVQAAVEEYHTVIGISSSS